MSGKGLKKIAKSLAEAKPEWYQSLAPATPVESCAQPATDIESCLKPSRIGRVTAQIGHNRAHGDRTVKMKIPVRHSYFVLELQL